VSELPDTHFSPTERQGYLDEVADYLPAFISSAATERADPVGDVSDLLNLRRTDLRKLLAIHLGLSAQVTSFAVSLNAGLRRPVMSSIRPRVSTQAVRGSIDWGATVRGWASGAGAATYVVRPARRIFDTPENRALAWVLGRLSQELQLVAGDPDTSQGWRGRLRENLILIERARRHPWLVDVPAQRPDAAAWKRLRAARTSFYKIIIPDVLRAVATWLEDPSPEDITELLSARYFEPKRDWQLFELVVALRIARAIGAVSASRRKGRIITHSGRSPYATYTLKDGAEVRLWYQAWPAAMTDSLYQRVRLRHEIEAGPTRPDIVIERRNVTPSLLLLEVKASRDASYLGQGVMQLLGYTKEYGTYLNEQACAWLVAPASTAFSAAEPEADEIWVVDAERVAEAVVARMAP
jgi:hypothetical protein